MSNNDNGWNSEAIKTVTEMGGIGSLTGPLGRDAIIKNPNRSEPDYRTLYHQSQQREAALRVALNDLVAASAFQYPDRVKLSEALDKARALLNNGD